MKLKNFLLIIVISIFSSKISAIELIKLISASRAFFVVFSFLGKQNG
mgnify:CR=1 FL=1